MRPAGRPTDALTRRRLLAIGGGGALGLALGTRRAAAAQRRQVVDFHGARQAGILTPPQGRLAFAAFDLTADGAANLADLLRAWTDAAARLTSGVPARRGADLGPAPPGDPGEALGLPPAHLTVTVGLGPGVFQRVGGLAAQRPPGLEPLPRLPGERLDPARCGGDLCVQACADDPQVAFHAVHALAHIGRGAVTLRWLQTGFTRSASGPGPHPTPRNLQGFKDGTANIRAGEAAALRRHVWVGPEGRRWHRGGTYLVVRRIRMHMDRWDRSPLSQQEAVIGRHKDSGAPLGGVHEHDRPDLSVPGAGGDPVIAMSAHIRQAAPASNGGIRMLRRGYSFADGVDPATGAVDAGLFFICFVRDPHRQFVPVQRRLGTSDALNDYIVHTGSAVFAIPPGVAPGGTIAERLLA